MTMDGRDGDPATRLTVAHRGGPLPHPRAGQEIEVDQPVGDGGERCSPAE